MTDLTARPLTAATWPDFARLVEKHGGIWGGCWCMAFHAEGAGRDRSPAQHREDKRCRVADDRAHAALIYDGPDVIGWCQYGPVDELPRIKHRRAYTAALDALPDWRITCFFVDRHHRGRGVAALALQAALDQIAHCGGGTVESYPEDTTDRKTSSSFLHNATAALFERHGFTRARRLGKHHWVMTRVIDPERA